MDESGIVVVELELPAVGGRKEDEDEEWLTGRVDDVVGIDLVVEDPPAGLFPFPFSLLTPCSPAPTPSSILSPSSKFDSSTFNGPIPNGLILLSNLLNLLSKDVRIEVMRVARRDV